MKKHIGTLQYYGLTINQFQTPDGYIYYQLPQSLSCVLGQLGVQNINALKVVHHDKGATTECYFGEHILPRLSPHPEDVEQYQNTKQYNPFNIPEELKNISHDYFYHYLWHNQAFEKDGKWGVCDYMGKLILPAEYDSCQIVTGLNNKGEGIIISRGNQKAYITGQSPESQTKWYDDIEPVYHSPDMLMSHKDGKFGLICADGRIMVPCSADFIFKDDQCTFPYIIKGKWGFVFYNMEQSDFVATDGLFDDFRGYENFMVRRGTQWGYIDNTGRFSTNIEERVKHLWTLGPYYDLAKQWEEVKPFSGTFPELEVSEGKQVSVSPKTLGLIKKYKSYLETLTSRDANEFNYLHRKISQYERSINWSAGIFEQNGQYGLRDTDGDVLLPAAFDEIKERPTDKYSHYTPAIVRIGNKWGLWAVTDDAENILPVQYDDIIYKGIMTGYEIIANGKHGLADFSGRVDIPCKMDFWVEKSEWLLFITVIDKKIGFYNHYGLYVKPEYDKFIIVGMKLFAKNGNSYVYMDLSASTTSSYPLEDKTLIAKLDSEGWTSADAYKWYMDEAEKVSRDGDNFLPKFISVLPDEDVNKPTNSTKL